MILKIFKAVWFFSMLVTLASLLYVYAALPEEVVVQEDGVKQVIVHRDTLFYVMTGIIAFVNVLVFILAKVVPEQEDFRAWFNGQIITINVFFIVGLFLVSLLNSQEKYDYARIAFVIYGSVVLIVVWAISWPIWKIFKRFSVKQAV
jgi:hypothetical protein